MKQSITKNQLKELTIEQLEKLQKWYDDEQVGRNKTSVLSPYLSIGQMIEYLRYEHNLVEFFNWPLDVGEAFGLRIRGHQAKTGQEFCDVLWDCVKKNIK